MPCRRLHLGSRRSNILGLNPLLLHLARGDEGCRVGLVRASNLHFAETDLVSRAIISSGLAEALVRGQCGTLTSRSVQLFLAFTMLTNHEVRLFKEIDTLGSKLEFGTSGITFSEFLVGFSGSRFATRSDLVMSSADVVSHKAGQR